MLCKGVENTLSPIAEQWDQRPNLFKSHRAASRGLTSSLNPPGEASSFIQIILKRVPSGEEEWKNERMRPAAPTGPPQQTETPRAVAHPPHSVRTRNRPPVVSVTPFTLIWCSYLVCFGQLLVSVARHNSYLIPAWTAVVEKASESSRGTATSLVFYLSRS